MSGSCELAPADAAFSTMLSAFIGSVLNGLFSGMTIAFFTGWISWLACLRILAAGCYEFFVTFKAGTNFQDNDKNYSYQGIAMGNVRVGGGVPATDEEARLTENTTPFPEDTAYNPNHGIPPGFIASQNAKYAAAHLKAARRWFKPPVRTVNIFGWLGWSWSAIYTPISQSIWLGTHIATEDRGILLIVRALAIAVSALSLTFDYKQRYGAQLGRKWGSWAFVTFNVWTSTVCLGLGIESAVLLIVGATRLKTTPVFVFPVYAFFSIVWAAASWKFLPPLDASRPGFHIVADLLMGAFAGIFVAAPAFILWRSTEFDKNFDGMYGQSSSSEGLSLNEFLKCSEASFWEKFAAVMP